MSAETWVEVRCKWCNAVACEAKPGSEVRLPCKNRKCAMWVETAVSQK